MTATGCEDPGMAPHMRELVLIDGTNVRRSTWPNVDEARLVAALDRWAASSPVTRRVVVTFDGPGADDAGGTDHVEVVVVRYADDELVRIAEEHVRAGGSIRAATSDRELRSRLQVVGAEVAWGGGGMLAELGLGGRGRSTPDR